MPGVVRGQPALEAELGDLAFERRSDVLLGDGAGALGPIAGDILFAGAPLDRFDQPAALARAFGRRLQLGERLVDQEGRRDQALARGP